MHHFIMKWCLTPSPRYIKRTKPSPPPPPGSQPPVKCADRLKREYMYEYYLLLHIPRASSQYEQCVLFNSHHFPTYLPR